MMTSNNDMQDYVISRYSRINQMPLFRDYNGDSNFMNFGYWQEDTLDQRQASENLMEKLLGMIPTREGSILDVACGLGGTTAYLSKYFSPTQITGINISESQLAMARSNAPGCTFRKMNAVNLEFKEATFDNIICVEAAFHFDTREQFLSGARRVLKPGGHIVLSDILMTLEGERTRKSHTEKNFLQNIDEYRALFNRVGFREVEIVDATEACWYSHYRNAVRYFHEKLLFQVIDREKLNEYLDGTYRRVPDIRNYLLVKAKKDI